MATIIDALLVTLGLDNSQFKKGQTETREETKKTRELTDKELKAMQQRQKEYAAMVGKVRDEVLKLATAFVSLNGIKNFATNLATGDASLGRMATNFGVSAQKVGAWEKVVKNFQGTAEDADSALRRLTMQAAQFQQKGEADPNALFALGRLGLSPQSFYSKSIDSHQRLLMLGKALHQQTPQNAQMYGQMLGMSEGMITALQQGGPALAQMVQQQEGLIKLNKEHIALMQRLVDSWNNLKSSLEGVGRGFIDKAGPMMISILDTMTKHAYLTAAGLTAIGVAASKWALIPALRAILGIGGAGAAAGEAAAGGAAAGGLMAKLGKFGRFLTNPLTLLAALMTYSGGLDAAPGEDTDVTAGKWDKKARPGGAKLPRNVRNNNPGNIEFGDFARKHGATGSDGRFAVFPDMATGAAAQKALLENYVRHGDDTIRKIVNRWAPGHENNTGAYMKDLSQRSGFGIDQKLSVADVRRLMNPMAIHEGAAAFIGALTGSTPAFAGQGGGDVYIGNIEINTQATDAAGIARDIHHQLRMRTRAGQSDSGMR